MKFIISAAHTNLSDFVFLLYYCFSLQSIKNKRIAEGYKMDYKMSSFIKRICQRVDLETHLGNCKEFAAKSKGFKCYDFLQKHLLHQS